MTRGTPLNLEGHQFGRLTAIEPTRTSSGTYAWLCRCECGGEAVVITGDLQSGHTRSCGCLSREVSSKNNRVDVTGQRFGHLVAVKRTNEKSGRTYKWLCVCDCGEETLVSVANLRNGHTQSCGCLNRKSIEETHLAKAKGKRFGKLVAMYSLGIGASGKRLWFCRCDCGNETVVQIDRLTVGTTKSCGCLRLRSGKESPAYKHHITSAQRIKNRYQLNGLNKRNWRTAVFKRDRYTCQVCGTPKSGHLNAHHLDGWNWAHLLRFEVSNGITLCDSCHTDFHNAYGRGDNTKEQFQQYLSMKGKSA